MMIEKVYVPNVPQVERRTGVATVTDRAVDLDVRDQSKKNMDQGQRDAKDRDDESSDPTAHPVAGDAGTKTPRINVVA